MPAMLNPLSTHFLSSYTVDSAILITLQIELSVTDISTKMAE